MASDKAKSGKGGGITDVGEWAERPTPAYTRPFEVGGEPVDTSKLPRFGEDPVSMGDLESTGDSGNYGDIYEEQLAEAEAAAAPRAPLRQ